MWSPPSAAAGACLEELRKARMKRKKSTHIVVIQRLMTPTWLKQLNKAANCIFTIPAIHNFWPSHNYEPLIVAIIYLYLTHRPYQLKGTYKMLHMGRSLSQVFKENQVDGGDLLLKFLLEVKRYQTMQQRMVWRLLYFGEPPPFPLHLPGETVIKGGHGADGKRKRNQKQKMERKRHKSTGFS